MSNTAVVQKIIRNFIFKLNPGITQSTGI